MPYVTYAERRLLEMSRDEGMEKGIEAVLEVRFPQEVSVLMPAVRQSSKMAELDRLLQLAKTGSLEEIRSALTQRPAP